MLPQPAAVPLARPIILLLNIVLIQNWHDTNVASENPIMNRTAMYPDGPAINDMQNTVGAESMIKKAHPYLGPSKSHTAPITSLENILPETEATPAFPMSALVRLRLSRMMGTRGAAAKVETKQVKKEIQDK